MAPHVVDDLLTYFIFLPVTFFFLGHLSRGAAYRYRGKLFNTVRHTGPLANLSEGLSIADADDRDPDFRPRGRLAASKHQRRASVVSSDDSRTPSACVRCSEDLRRVLLVDPLDQCSGTAADRYTG